MMQKIEGLELGIRTILRSHPELPRMVQIAITSKCNMTCKMCPREHIKTSNTHLPVKKAKQIIDKLKGVPRVALVGLGEPLLHPNLCEIIRYCNNKGIYTQTTTNGILLKGKLMQDLINSGLNNLAVSIERLDGNTQQGHYDNSAAENLKRFIEFRNKQGSDNPIITMQIILLSEVIEEIPAIIEWAEDAGVELINLSRTNALLIPGLKRPSRAEEKIFFKDLRKLRKKHKIRIDCMQDQIFPGLLGRLYRISLPLARLDSWCIKWSYYTYILEDGQIRPCSAFYPKEMALGNIFENTLEEIWNGEKYKALRNSRAKWNPCIACDNLRLNQRKSPGFGKKMPGSEIGVI